MLGLHQFETVKVGEIGADLLSGQSLSPVGGLPFLVDLSLSPGLAESAFTSAVWDLDQEFGQIERLDVDGLTADTGSWSIDESLPKADERTNVTLSGQVGGEEMEKGWTAWSTDSE